jgi:hypothetical protein
VRPATGLQEAGLRGREDIDLVLDSDERAGRRHQAVGRIAACRIGDHADDAAMHEALLLRELVAERQLDLAVTGLDSRDRGPDVTHRFLPVEALQHAQRKAGVGRREAGRGSVHGGAWKATLRLR